MSDISSRKRRAARDFRLVQGIVATVLVALAYWLFVTPGVGIWRWILGPVFGLVGLFAAIDVINGPFSRSRK